MTIGGLHENAPPEIASGGAFRVLAVRYNSACRSNRSSTWMRMMATMNERSSIPTGGTTRRSGAMTGSVTSASMRVDSPLPARVKPGEERSTDERVGQKLQECQQNAEDGFRHKIAVLAVPAWVSGDRVVIGASSIEPKWRTRAGSRDDLLLIDITYRRSSAVPAVSTRTPPPARSRRWPAGAHRGAVAPNTSQLPARLPGRRRQQDKLSRRRRGHRR